MVKVIALAVLGGYAGPALLRQAIDKTISDVEDQVNKRVDSVEGRLEAHTEKAAKIHDEIHEEVDAINERFKRDQAAMYISLKQLAAPRQDREFHEEIARAIKTASDQARLQIFINARLLRRNTWNKDKARMERTIPVFKALADADASDANGHGRKHFYWAEYGYTLKDKQVPDWLGAFENLDNAIRIREEQRDAPSHATYEFNRAICGIHLNKNKDQIVADLREAYSCETNHGRVEESADITRWLAENKLSLSMLNIQRTHQEESA